MNAGKKDGAAGTGANDVPVGLEGGLSLFPKADAAACSVEYGRLVCFGTDLATYQKYLVLADGGASPGQCPSTTDFQPSGGEGSCGYSACGPIPDDQIPTYLIDAGADIGDAGTGCCFIAIYLCGI